ncbi:MAG TPA: DUF1631 family protein, partial [Casimicrobiaceae bacterium]|nr:DUF1631 family protein [Casimicrobiaceae bacterium]
PQAAARRPVSREMSKILADCRDLAIHRLLLTFTTLLDKVGDMLMERAGRTDVREEQSMLLDARLTLKAERPKLLAEFERCLRTHVNDSIAGKEAAKADFSKAAADNLTLVDTSVMDESVILGNITRVIENTCYDELQTLNRAIGHLLGRPDLETTQNPLAPAMIVSSFAEALKTVKSEERMKAAVLKELNQSPLGDISGIYADLNKHLASLRVIPAGRSAIVNRGSPADRTRGAHAAPGLPSTPMPHEAPVAEVDVMALFRRMFAGQAVPARPTFPAMGGVPEIPSGGFGMPSGAPWDMGGPPMMPPGAPMGVPGAGPAPGMLDGAVGAGEFPHIDMGGAPASGMRYIPSGPLPPTPSGYVPGAPIIATPQLGEGLARLQAGESGFDLGGGMFVQFSGIPQGTHNVLRDLQESPLGKKANQLESMTIELVAMLFDFVFETRDLPDGIKALLARLQIPVLKAAMLDGAFFAKKSHPARLLVNALAQAGLGWAPAMGPDDPLYKKIDEIVHKILDGFSDNLGLFDELRDDLEAFLAEEEKAAEANIQSTAEEINQSDRKQIATGVSKAEVERRVEQYPIPNFLAAFLRTQWLAALEQVYLRHGEESEPWSQAVATLEDLVWSVQPKKTNEDRRHLVALLPSLLKRMSAGMHDVPWPPENRERFMTNLVEAHAAAVKPALAAVALPTVAVAEQAKAEAEIAKAAGDEAAAAKAEQLAAAMEQAAPAPAEPEPEVIDDQFLEIAQSLERGMWIEFEAEDGQLAFAKLAWISPLRGTYLFTNRQGQKALSMTAEELATRFRSDSARLVEAEPLIDRAFGSMMQQIDDQFPAAEVAAD